VLYYLEIGNFHNFSVLFASLEKLLELFYFMCEAKENDKLFIVISQLISMQDVPDDWENSNIEVVANRPIKTPEKPKQRPEFPRILPPSQRGEPIASESPTTPTAVTFPELDLEKRVYSIEFLKKFQPKYTVC